MKRLPKVNRADWHLVPINPDPGFDPEHNKRVIEETIRINDEKLKKQQADFKAQTDERVADLTMYLKNLDQGGGNSDIEQYFGKKRAAYLRGEHIISKLRENIIFRNSTGKIVKRAGEI